MTERLIQIHISSPSTTDGRDDGQVVVRMEDQISGVLLGEVEMPAGRFWRLCQGSILVMKGSTGPDLQHVGMKHNHGEVRVPKEVHDRVYTKEQVEPLIEAWLADGNLPTHWESYWIYHHNYGWAVHGSWWTPLTPEEYQVWYEKEMEWRS